MSSTCRIIIVAGRCAAAALLISLEKISPNPLRYLSTQMLIMRIISNSFHQAHWQRLFLPLARTAFLQHASQISHHLHHAAVHSDSGTKMAISPTAASNQINMEIGSSLSSLCACFPVLLRSVSDPVDQWSSEEKARLIGIFLFYLIQRL